MKKLVVVAEKEELKLVKECGYDHFPVFDNWCRNIECDKKA